MCYLVKIQKLHSVVQVEYLYYICQISILIIIRANEICKRKNKSKITVNDVIEAMKETGFDNFQSDIEELLMEINRTTSSPNKKRKADDEFIEIDKKEMK